MNKEGKKTTRSASEEAELELERDRPVSLEEDY